MAYQVYIKKCGVDSADLYTLVRNSEEVIREVRDVDEHPWRDFPDLVYAEKRPGVVHRVAAQRLLDCDLLLRNPSVRILPVESSPRYCGVDSDDWIERRDGPVGSERHRRSGVDQRAKRIRPSRPLVSELRLRPPPVVDRVIRLHRPDPPIAAQPLLHTEP